MSPCSRAIINVNGIRIFFNNYWMSQFCKKYASLLSVLQIIKNVQGLLDSDLIALSGNEFF